MDGAITVADLLPELLDTLPPDRLEMARERLRARVLRIRRGRWDASTDAQHVQGGIGFVVVEGALLRCVTAAHRTSGELLGPGDILRPAQDPTVEPPFGTYWRAVADTTLALLDARFATSSAQFPEVAGALVASVTRRAGAVGRQLVIVQSQSVETRIITTLQQLAERWGVVTTDGLVLPEFLTHGTLALLLGARRPSVTSAMVRLSKEGRLHRRDDGRWLLVPSAEDERAA